jgi:hypothetical protein
MRSPSAGLFYIFCDEKYLGLRGKRQILTSHVAIPQGSWKNLPDAYKRLEEPKAMSRLDRIEAILVKTDGLAVVAQSEFSHEMLPKGKRDRMIDLPDLSRADNAWSATMALGLVTVFPRLYKIGVKVQTVDVYYDNRKLKREHSIKMEELITVEMPKRIRKVSRSTRMSPEDNPRVRRFQGISKPAAGEEPNQFQVGLNLAHHLLQSWRDIRSKPRNRIIAIDITEDAMHYFRKFQR